MGKTRIKRIIREKILRKPVPREIQVTFTDKFEKDVKKRVDELLKDVRSNKVPIIAFDMRTSMGGPEHFESLWPNVLAHNESGKSVLEDEYNIERALGFMHQVDKVFYSETSVRNNVAPGYFEGNKNYVILQHPNAIMADLGFGRKEPMKAFVLLRGKHLDTALDVHAHPILEAYFYQKLGEALAELARNGQIKSSRGSAKKIIPVEEQRGFHARGSLTAVQTAYLSDKGYKVPDSHPFRVFGGSWYNVKFSEEYVKRLKKLKEMGHIRVNDDLLFDEYVGNMRKVIKAMKWGLKP